MIQVTRGQAHRVEAQLKVEVPFHFRLLPLRHVEVAHVLRQVLHLTMTDTKNKARR